MTNSKAKQITTASLHLRLTTEDWEECFTSLTRAELGLFMWIRTQNPFGDRQIEIDCSHIANKLQMHRTSVSRALEALSRKQLIDLEITRAKVGLSVKPNKLTLILDTENQSISEQEEEKESCAPTHTDVHPRTPECVHAHESAPTHTAERTRTKRRLEPLPDKDSGTPHTIQTNKHIKNTTEGSERKKRVEQPKPPKEGSERKKRVEQPKSPQEESRGGVIEIFEKYKDQLNKHGVYLMSYQNDLLQLNPKIEPVIQESGKLPSEKVEPAIKAFIAWISRAKDVKEPYRAFFKAIKETWQEL